MMQQNNVPQGAAYAPPVDLPKETTVVQPPEKRKYKNIESIFAWISLIFGYLFCRAVPAHVHPLGALICFVLLFAVTAFLLFRNRKPIPKAAILSMVSAFLVLGVLFLSANAVLQSFAFCYCIAAYGHFVFTVCGDGLGRKHPEFLLADYCKALLILPFASFGLIFPALGGAKRQKWGSAALKVVCGLAAALIPTAIIISLLSYDADFVSLLDQIFSFGIDDVFSHLFSAVCGVPVGMYLFGLYYSATNHKCQSVLTATGCRKAVQTLRFAPALVLICAVLPILAVYVIFFLSQWRYYVSGFFGVLPEDFSYAAYARNGFFELLGVSTINLALIAALTLFWRRTTKKVPAMLRLLSVAYAGCTLILIGTAMAKLALYIEAYGLTPKRVYAAWFMVVLVVLFVLICIRQFVRKFRLIPTALISVVLLFALLGLSGSDTWIANYNVDRYLAGDLETVDVVALEELGDAAVPAMVRLAAQLDEGSHTSVKEDVLSADPDWYFASDEDVYSRIVVALGHAAGRAEGGVFELTLPAIRAKAALRSIDLPLGEAFEEQRQELIDTDQDWIEW